MIAIRKSASVAGARRAIEILKTKRKNDRGARRPAISLQVGAEAVMIDCRKKDPTTIKK